MRKIIFATAAIFIIAACSKSDDMKLKEIVDNIENAIKPLSKEAAIAYWNGTITGESGYFESYSQNSMKITSIYSDPTTFATLKSIKERDKVEDPLLKRELEILYNNFLSNQADTSVLNDIIKRSALLEQKYASFRALYKEREVSDNEIEQILKSSQNNKDLEEAWRAHKKIGPFVAEDVIELIKLRNFIAKSLGFDNFHTMSLELSGQNPADISALFDELDSLTRDSFAALKKEMNSLFSKLYKVDEDMLMPWHFQGRFFQESPQLYTVDLDKYYKGQNLETLTSTFYKGIGLNVDIIMANSDLYEKPKKNQHAYCTDIDSDGDIRVLGNISDNEQWMGTMLHEFGHAVYSQGHDIPGNPYFLRNAAHSFTTEAVAMIFGRLSRNPQWMKQMLNISDEETEKIAEDCRKSLRLQQLVFSRWVQVVYRFEKSMYANPDQDLNKLWWDLVQEYQMLNKPQGRDEPDWATKIHIALYPCYYHNYQLGELLASQMHYYIVDNITKSGNYKDECYIGNHLVGSWMSKNVFAPGMRYHWNDMIERATGEKLTAKYYALQFVE
ncbi:MAG: peptidase M3 [Bacteroidetes bacterium HGW-Bacteroidetes-8]|jgi:peptidyl-dipeptidase A|nr:MAG: peptidase M3 [Bacteroidetes bacterium HGW-Bacteroidetes-8]